MSPSFLYACWLIFRSFFFFFNDPAPPEIYPLPLHDALPIYEVELPELVAALASALRASVTVEDTDGRVLASAPAEGYCPPPAPAARRAGAARAAGSGEDKAVLPSPSELVFRLLP